MTRLVLPLPPSVNHMYRNFTKGGRRMRVITHDGQKWQQDARLIAQAWRGRNAWIIAADSKIALKLWYYWPDNRRTDTHNRSKILCDTLEGILYEDDRWVLVQEQDFDVDRSNPRVEVELQAVR